MIKELLPPLIEEYLRDRIETFNIDVMTSLNGKSNDIGNLRQDIVDYFSDLINKSIK